MALNRTEIELLIKARNDAQGAFDQLNKQVKSVTGESDKATESMDNLGKKTKDTGVAAGAAGVAFGLLAERVGRALVGAFQDTIKEANDLDRGLIGLGATAKAFGTSADAAQSAAKSLAADGLMNVGEAASGLKNLLAGGFNLPQAIELMNRFKDSAAFGRQGSLEFGQAIVGATEGIKNGNSALVDNAGLTKNLSNILVEAGFSAQDLSKVQSDLNVRTALYNGILKETNPQLGQTALLLETAQGKQVQFNSQITIAEQKIGKGLQPALGSLLQTLTPMVQFVGDNAGAFIALGTTVATVVGPLAAMKAMAALGIPTLGELGTKAFSLVQDFADLSLQTGTLRGGMNALASQSGLTVGNLGLLKSAALVAGAAFIGWEVGTAIAKLTGLDKAIERTVDKLTGLTGQTQGAQQDVIARAVANGANQWIKYADAIKYNQDVMTAHLKVQADNTAGLRAQAEAQERIGMIDAGTLATKLILIDAQERENAQHKASASLKDALTTSSKKYNEEIEKTGMTVPQLTAAMAKDEDAFKKWADTVGLSDSTVKKLKDSLTETEKQHTKNTEAATKAAAAQKEFLKQLEDQAGILTQGGLNAKLAEYEKFLTLAANQGTPALTGAVKNLWPEFQKLAQQAKDSGLSVEHLNAVFNQAAQGAGLILATTRQFNTIVPLMAGVTEANRVNTAEVRLAIKAQDDLKGAYKAFGLQAPDDLRKVAQESKRNYDLLLSSGVATTAQLKTAWRQMTDDQKAASGELPGYWEKNIFPAIKGTVEQIGKAVEGTFAQMILGAKSFGEGFQDIWQTLKKGVTQILAEILQQFTETFIKGLLGAMAGQQGAFGAAFGNMFSGTGTGGGGGLLGNLFGGGAGGAAGGGGALEPIGLVGTGGAGVAGAGAAGGGAGGAGAAGGGAGTGVGLAAVGGGIGAGAAGVGFGLLGKNIFGGAGFKSSGFGAAGGAASGALIGSIVPGLGTAIGAIIGGLAGAITGWVGKSQEDKGRDQFLGMFGGKGTGEGSGFATLAGELAKLSKAAGGGEGGGTLFANLFKANNAREFEKAIRDIQTALEGTEYATIAVNEATDQLTQQREAAVAAGQNEDDVIRQQAESYSVLLQQIVKNGVEAPEALQPTLQKLVDLGLLVDANGQKVTTLEGIYRRSGDKIEDAVQGVQDETKNLGRAADDAGRAVSRAMSGIERQFDSAGLAAYDAAGDIQNAFDGLSFDIPVNYTVADFPTGPTDSGGGPPPEDVPQAAQGVMASRASLVLFGEGGEPEVGGPRSFFKDVFRELQKEGVATGGGQAAGPTFIFQISGLGPQDIATTLQVQVLPKILDLIRTNRGGSLTDIKQILGV